MVAIPCACARARRHSPAKSDTFRRQPAASPSSAPAVEHGVRCSGAAGSAGRTPSICSAAACLTSWRCPSGFYHRLPSCCRRRHHRSQHAVLRPHGRQPLPPPRAVRRPRAQHPSASGARPNARPGQPRPCHNAPARRSPQHRCRRGLRRHRHPQRHPLRQPRPPRCQPCRRSCRPQQRAQRHRL